MAYLKINRKRYLFLLGYGTGDEERLRFFSENKAPLIMKGAKVQNLPKSPENRIKTMLNLPTGSDPIVQKWFSTNLTMIDPVSVEELVETFRLYEKAGEALPESDREKLSRSCLIHLFSSAPSPKLVEFLKSPILKSPIGDKGQEQDHESESESDNEIMPHSCRGRVANDLLVQHEDSDFAEDNIESTLSETEPQSPNSKTPKFTDLSVEKPTVGNHEPENVRKLNQFYLSKIHELNNLVEKAKAEHHHTTEMIKRCLASQDDVKEINATIQALEKLRRFVCAAEGGAAEVEKGIGAAVMEVMQQLSIVLAPIEFPKFHISTFDQWKKEVTTHQEVARKVLLCANALTEFDQTLIQEITVGHKEKTIALEGAAQYLKTIENEAIVLSRGLKARQELLSALQAKQDDFSWNPILDSSIPDECWIHLGEHLATQGTMPRVLGVCTRKHYRHLHAKLAEFIDSFSTRDDIPLEDAFNVLANMTLGQIEGLKCNTEEGKTLLAVAELNSFLHIASISPIEAYEFLSARPLSDYVNEHSLSKTERFFMAAFKASSREGDGRLTITELRRLISLANPVSLSKPEQINELLMGNLPAIPEFHSGGQSVAHVQLRELAYMTICGPVKEEIEKGKLNDAADHYRQFRREFDIEGHLSDWISTIRADLRKQSQYKSKLRQVVKRMLEDLDDWLYYYDSSQSFAVPIAADDPAAILKAAIYDVLSARDTGCNILQRWFQVLSKAPIHQANLSTPSRTIEQNFTKELHQGNDDAFHPRVFLAETKGTSATIADFLADELFLSFGLYTTENLAKAYEDQHCYEAFAALAVASPENISVDIERRIEANINKLEDQYLSRIEAVESKTTTLGQQNTEFISSSVADVRCLLSNQQWTKTGQELSDLERVLNDLIQEEESNRLADRYRAEITALGGSVPIDASFQAVQEARKRIIAETKPRRQHLESLKKILAIEGLDTTVRDEYLATMSEMERPENLPSAERSEEVALLVFSETIEILGNELPRSNQLLPDYARKLKILALRVAKYLKEYGVNDQSKIVTFLLDTEAVWKKIPSGGAAVIDQLIGEFSAEGFVTTAEADVIPVNPPSHVELPIAHRHEAEQQNESHGNFAAYVDRLANALSRIGTSSEEKGQSQPTAADQVNRENKLSETARQARILFEKCDDSRSISALGHLTDWAVSMLKNHVEMLSVEDHAAALHMVNRFQKSSSVINLLPTKTSKGQLGDMAARFLERFAKDCGLAVSPNPIDQILDLSNNIGLLITRRYLLVVSFSPIGSDDSLTAKNLWDLYSGDNRQAEARAALMNVLWQTSAPRALACCLRYDPVKLDAPTADALANIADQALSKGRAELLQSFTDMRRTVSAKPFQLFVELMLLKMPTKADPPAQISLVGPLERNSEPNSLSGILSIKPRRSDSPNLITLRLPQTSPVSFDSGVLNKVLKGPFIDEEILLQVSFQLRDQNAYHFTVLIDCTATSITGVPSEFPIRLDFEILGVGSYFKISPEEIEEAFQQFHPGQMRGEDYIHRPDDERRIERDLFKSKTIRSLWISSPRRSGKTTMLYRILDSYSHKAGRDNLIAYFSLSKSFDSTAIFNEWIWKTLKTSPDNIELRDLCGNFSKLGLDLPFDADLGTFIENLADRLVSSTKANRIIFLFDEIDKLATMFFEGGARKDTAMEIAWELRRLINRRRDIGFVFAGSSAAKKIFLTNHDAPFFNAGILFELSPFSCETPEKEIHAREIIEPQRIRGKLTIPKKSLQHMLWICSGIPYYMKLLAGATYAVTKQSHVLISDVNEGLHALLEKRTGVSRLDEAEGDPGSDELWTIALEKGADLLLTKGVLYAAAELESPLSGHPLLKAHLYGVSSPLITRYQLPKKGIERGLNRSIEFGLLKQSSDSPPKISFAIPILGEAIRNAKGSYWAEIDDELEQLGKEFGAAST